MQTIRQRTEAFCGRFALKAPLLLAPMAGACPASLSIAVAQAGGLGACGLVRATRSAAPGTPAARIQLVELGELLLQQDQ